MPKAGSRFDWERLNPTAKKWWLSLVRRTSSSPFGPLQAHAEMRGDPNAFLCACLRSPIFSHAKPSYGNPLRIFSNRFSRFLLALSSSFGTSSSSVGRVLSYALR